MYEPMRYLCALLCLLLATSPSWGASLAEDQTTAVILAYQRIAEDTNSETSLSEEQFDQHLDMFLNGHLKILPLPQIIHAWQNNEALPENTIAITFDGAHSSAYQHAMTKLIEHNIPFTVFYASETGTPNYIDTKTLKKLAKNKFVTIGVLPAQFDRHSHKSDDDIRATIFKAITHYRNTFKRAPTLFSYPFGEFSNSYKNIIRDSGFIAAFSLQSGASYAGSDRLALPRFSMNGHHGSIERLQFVTKALPLPATDITPTSTHIASEEPKTIGFTVSNALTNELRKLSCFVSGQNKPTIEIIGNRVEIRPKTPITSRTRVNCTLPAQKGRETLWRWQGFLISSP
jgi:peptidoglycan/xylan/chitin deacetylase (PgdA/CDA1 family)